ncbi:MAG: ORF6N domain-containing protein [Methylacidiphilales bacterium]|nr:ORF6N domain-containing protein [Candidatus Methylacidiphilales bacterium]
MKTGRPIETLILNLRGQKAILDANLAELYGVPTKVFNQAVKRNEERFPIDFRFQLTPEEWLKLRSHTASSKSEMSRDEAVALNRSQIVTGSQRHRDPRYLPYVLTEHGAIMAATVLNSPQAVAMSVYVVRAFIQMREQIAANAGILKCLAQIDKTLLVHDKALRDIYQKLLPLLAPSPVSPKPMIGFEP